MMEGYIDCPVCEGTGEGTFTNEDGECTFCDAYGFVFPVYDEYEDKVNISEYRQYLTGKKLLFQQETDEIVIEGGPSFFDEPGTPEQRIKVTRD